MVPKMPPREGQPGFLYVPPYRIQGISIAGEQTAVHVPELDVVFDIGLCPRIALSASTIALSHTHMDHVAALSYYFSQRMFQQIGVGRCVCHARSEPAIRAMMQTWIDLESQRTPHEIIGVEPDDEVKLKNNIYLRAIEVSHTAPAMGYAIIERRSKLKDEFKGLPQERLRELKASGETITKMLEIPLVAYTGDTEVGPFLFRDEFADAKIVIAECTFVEPDHRSRARVGKHLHIEDLAALFEVWKAEAVVLVHLSRRSTIAFARQRLVDLIGEEQAARALFLMDHRTNRARYEQQREAAAANDTGACPAKNAPNG
jgi:ribonuclease Z